MQRYLGWDVAPGDPAPEADIVEALIRLAFTSVANMAVVTVQDLLHLGTEARMNTPGTSGNNWQWRSPAGALNDDVAQWLGALAETYGRAIPR